MRRDPPSARSSVTSVHLRESREQEILTPLLAVPQHHFLAESLENYPVCFFIMSCVSPDCELPRTEIIIALIAVIYSVRTMCHTLF